MNTWPDKITRRNILTALALFTLHSVTVYQFGIRGPDFGMVYMFKPAFDMARGFSLFSETFTVYGALTTYIHFFFIKLFGESVHSLVLAASLFYGLNAILLYAIFARYFPCWINVIANFLVLALAPFYFWPFLAWSSVYANTFALLSVLCFVNSNKKYYRLFAAGFFASLSFWCRQPVGILLSGSYVFLMALDAIRPTKDLQFFLAGPIAYFIGFLFPSSLFFLTLWQQNSINDWYLQSIVHAKVWALIYGGNTTKVLTSLFQLFAGDSCNGFGVGIKSLLWRFLAVSNLCIFTVSLINRFFQKSIFFNKHNQFLLTISCVNLALWHQYYPVPCMRHTYWASILMVAPLLYALSLVASILAQYFPGPHKKKAAFVLSICLIALTFSYDLYKRIDAGIKKASYHYNNTETPFFLKGIKTDNQFEQMIAISHLLESYMQQNKKVLIVSFGRQWFNFLQSYMDSQAVRKAPTRALFVNWNSSENRDVYPTWWKELTKIVRENHPIIIAYAPLYTPPSPEKYEGHTFGEIKVYLPVSGN